MRKEAVMVFRWIVWLALSIAITSPALAEEAQWLVITAPAFRDGLQPLCEQRKAQGFRVVVVSTSDILDAKQIRAGDATRLRDHIHKLCREFKGPSYVLLVGAIDAGQLREPEKFVVPALRGSVSRMKDQPSDNGYGCLGEDLLPTVAVGRFPVQSVAEAEGMVKKTLAYEKTGGPGDWRRRLTVLAGIPAYNPLIDRLVESQALARFDKLSPLWSGRALYQNPQSRFCVPDDQLHDRALQCVEDGQAFTLYLGHSNARGLWGGGARFLDRDDFARLTIRRGAGVFATFGCNGCQLRGDDGEGYGVAAMRNPSGPAAVLGSHGICFAAMVQLAADGLFQAGFTGKCPERLGAMWLGLKNGLAKGKIDAGTYTLLDAVDGDKDIPQSVQRQEHLEMFVLLGDPALRLPGLPDDVRLNVDGEAAAGKSVIVRGEVPERLRGAKVRLTLERPLSSEPESLALVPRKAGPERNRLLLANHERANNFVVASKEITLAGNQFENRIQLPAEIPWPRLILRAFATTQRADGIGILVLPVQSER
jgi:hypothetical protein